MDDNNRGTTGGIGFSGCLTIAFIILKLLGVINWNWWWVLSPLWISAAIALALIITIIAVAAISVRDEHNNDINKKDEVHKDD